MHATSLNLLLEHGADINTRFSDSSTLLHIVAINGSAEDVCVLLGHGAEVDATDEKAWTPLHVATRNRTHPRDARAWY
jgi:ankyrin repeat protein